MINLNFKYLFLRSVVNNTNGKSISKNRANLVQKKQ